MLNSVIFEGPCKGVMDFVIKGVLLAPIDPSLFNTDKWINFKYVQNLIVSGGGKLDGQGAMAWSQPVHQEFKLSTPSYSKLFLVSHKLVFFFPFY